MKKAEKPLLASGLACLIIGLSASQSQADDNASQRFTQGIWPDAYKKMKDKTREEEVKEEALKLKERAQEEREEQERERNQADTQRSKPSLDNSQVLPSPFQDIELNLKRNSSIDLLLRNRPKPQTIPEQHDETAPGQKDTFTKSHSASSNEEDDEGFGENEKDDLNNKSDKRQKKDEKRLKKPVDVSPNDWVPDKFDPLNNGGFETSPDNGSPVPYRLNGHVDLERGRPWLHD